MTRSKSWQIAADLEAAAKAVREAELAVNAIHRIAMAEVWQIPGIEFVDFAVAADLQALSDKYQAIADAEEEI